MITLIILDQNDRGLEVPSEEMVLTSKEACDGLEAGHCKEKVFHAIQSVPTFMLSILPYCL